MNRIGLFRPTLGALELSAIKEVFESGWIGYGPRCEGVERAWAFTVGSRYGVALNSCTSALQIALRLRGVGPGDEVIVPTITFAATAEAVIAVGATPVFCDVHPDTLLIDLESAESVRSPSTRAVIAVLYAGQLLDIGNEWAGIPVIYDCAHAAGSSFNATGKLCCWSFQAVKNLGCGDGGMVTTDSEVDQVRAKSLAWHGISRSTWDRSAGKHYTWEYDIGEIGYKAQMNDITAAILSVQIGRMGELQQQRRHLAYRYAQQLQGVPIVGVSGQMDLQSWHLFVIQSERRNELADFLALRQISTGVHYKPLHLHTAFRELPQPIFGSQPALPNAERAWNRILSLPMYPELTSQNVDFVCDSIREFNYFNMSEESVA